MEEERLQVNKKMLLAISMLSSFLNPFRAAAINIALPKIGQHFSMNAVYMSWIAMSFLLASAVILVPMGKLADIFGRKRIFLYGNIVVAIASTLCSIAPSATMLIIFRVLQGIGSAMIFGTIMALVTSAFPPGERGRFIGLNVTATYFGLSIAPVLGGYITQMLGWRVLLFITMPFTLLTIILTMIYLKVEWRGAQDEKFDYNGSLIYILAMSAFMLGFSRLPDPMAIAVTTAGFAGLVFFVSLELRTTFPVLNIQLFAKNRVFAFSNLAALINYAATFAISFVLSLYLQYAKGLSPKDTGLILMVQPVLMAGFASVAGRMSDTYDSRILSSVGMGIIVIGLVMLSFLDGTTGTSYLVISQVILGAGFGIFSSPNTNSVMGSVDRKYLGIASAMVSTMRITGQMMSMGIATMIIHVFIGNAKISIQNAQAFNGSVKIIFLVFSVLCLLGVFASLARGKKVATGN